MNFINYLKKYKGFKNSMRDGRFNLHWKDRKLCLKDDTSGLGYDRHYIYHTAWAARILKETNPKEHVDISSIIYFNTILSAFIPIRFYDFRPPEIELSGLKTGKADLTNLDFTDNSIESLSCMHTVEHLGLGRYGDPIDPSADKKACSELSRVLAKDGNLLFVVPVGKPKIMFNAHRIYSPKMIIEAFSELQLKEFSLIPNKPNNTGIIKNPNDKMISEQTYAAGCFWFRKE
ncbi:MAG: DUF268 domain-containing protein [bacterium]